MSNNKSVSAYAEALYRKCKAIGDAMMNDTGTGSSGKVTCLGSLALGGSNSRSVFFCIADSSFVYDRSARIPKDELRIYLLHPAFGLVASVPYRLRYSLADAIRLSLHVNEPVSEQLMRLMIDRCHYELGVSSTGKKGNPNCPAKHLRIVRGINFDAMSDTLAEVMASSDAKRLKKISKELSKLDPIVSNRVFALATEKLKQQ